MGAAIWTLMGGVTVAVVTIVGGARRDRRVARNAREYAALTELAQAVLDAGNASDRARSEQLDQVAFEDLHRTLRACELKTALVSSREVRVATTEWLSMLAGPNDAAGPTAVVAWFRVLGKIGDEMRTHR